jgi:GntR family transcriptional regulator
VLIRIDPTSEAALFAQVAASIRTEMASGRLRAGERLPSARDVAQSLGVNLHTVLRAYQELREEGLVDMRRGRGAVVTERAASLGDLRAEIVALGERARSLGMAPDTLISLVRASLSG